MVSDFVKLMNSAAGTFAGMTREAREAAREKMKGAFGGLDFVTPRGIRRGEGNGFQGTGRKRKTF